MTSLDKFLNEENESPRIDQNETALGSFSCQDFECNEINTEAFIDKEKNKLYWICSNGHKSSVVF